MLMTFSKNAVKMSVRQFLDFLPIFVMIVKLNLFFIKLLRRCKHQREMMKRMKDWKQ